MRKLFGSALLIVLGLFLFSSGNVQAANYRYRNARTVSTKTTLTRTKARTTKSSLRFPIGKDLKLAFKPYKSTDNNWLTARINNMTQNSQSNLICVEGSHTNGRRMNLGCLTVDWSTLNNTPIWNFEFNAPLYLNKGRWISYTYKNGQGKWYNISTINSNSVAQKVR
jgi:hypothetical protein